MRPPARGRAAVAAAVAAVLLLVGCDRAGDDAVAGPPVPAATSDPDPAPGDGAAPVHEATADGRGLRDDLVVDVTRSHPNGVVIQVSKVRFPPDAIELEVEILNGFDGLVSLDGGIPSQRLHVVDDLGNGYPLSPPPGNPTVDVEEGESLQGTLVFLGRVDPAATELTLRTHGGEASRHAELPAVDLDIVIPLGAR